MNQVKVKHLIEFCSYGESRDNRTWMNEVNRSGEKAVATNGHLIVVMTGVRPNPINAFIEKQLMQFQSAREEDLVFTCVEASELPRESFQPDENIEDLQVFPVGTMLRKLQFFGCCFRGVEVQAAYMQVICKLPGVKFPKACSKDRPISFVWAGGWGALMPMSNQRPLVVDAPWGK